VATAIVAGLGERTSLSATRALWILLASALFFWAAHVYAALLAQRIQRRIPTTWADVRGLTARESPLFYSSLPLALPLVLSWFGFLAGHMALGVATLVGVVALVGWGVAFSRREGFGLTGVVAAASVNAAVGVLIVGMKLAVR
jgi:hypothetical protein